MFRKFFRLAKDSSTLKLLLRKKLIKSFPIYSQIIDGNLNLFSYLCGIKVILGPALKKIKRTFDKILFIELDFPIFFDRKSNDKISDGNQYLFVKIIEFLCYDNAGLEQFEDLRAGIQDLELIKLKIVQLSSFSR